ncbi:uncharacterized protein LOC142995336 [Genypterus blacodes]|uniref:uncharacterized protein LOC142995336 n=1 Tax=Genypterus blacodes TaxID=154954 RepID=UPI003F762489
MSADVALQTLIPRKINMHLKVVIFALSFLTTLAHPLYRDGANREAADPKANQAHVKAVYSKDVNKTYKSHMDSSHIYSQEDDRNTNPLAAEMQHKLNMESERLRARLRQELAELQERLSPNPAHLSSTLASMRERLAPLTQQLQTSLSSNTQDLCGQLSLYLQGLETAEVQAEVGPALYQEAFQWMSQTLEHSRSNMADIIGHFQTKSTEAIEHLKEISEGDGGKSELWQEMSYRLGQEVNSLRVETQIRAATLKSELATALGTDQPFRAEVVASVDRFCQSAALQSQVLARVERMFVGLEEELEVKAHSSASTPSSLQSGGSLQESFTLKLSALIQDILHSVQ